MKRSIAQILFTGIFLSAYAQSINFPKPKPTPQNENIGMIVCNHIKENAIYSSKKDKDGHEVLGRSLQTKYLTYNYQCHYGQNTPIGIYVDLESKVTGRSKGFIDNSIDGTIEFIVLNRDQIIPFNELEKKEKKKSKLEFENALKLYHDFNN